MGLFADRDVRMVGLGLVLSPVMFMAYEIFQIVMQLHLDNQVLLNGDMLEIARKMWAVLPTMFIGIGLLVYFERVNKKREEGKTSSVMAKWKWAVVGLICVVLIGLGVALEEYYKSIELLYFIGGSGVITIIVFAITSYANKKTTDELNTRIGVLDGKIDTILKNMNKDKTEEAKSN